MSKVCQIEKSFQNFKFAQNVGHSCRRILQCVQSKNDGGMAMNPILVVDDNEQIVDILLQYIKKEGWPMLAAKTG